MLIKLSESVQMANMNLLAGEKDYPGKATEDNTQYQGEDRGDYREQGYGTYADFLTTSFKHLDVLV